MTELGPPYCHPTAGSDVRASSRSAVGHEDTRALRRTGRSEPPRQRVSEPRLGLLTYPGHIAVGPDQHDSGSGDRAEHRKLPRAVVSGVDLLDPVRPWRDVDATGLTEVH